MNTRHCCKQSGRRVPRIMLVAAPSAILLLLPKCPLCLLAYLGMGSGALALGIGTLATGLGVSIATTTKLCAVLLGLSAQALIYAARRYRRRLAV